MINLVPAVVRKAIITEYWFRVVSVWFLIASIINISITLFALPGYVLVTSQVSTYAQSAAEAAQRVEEYDFSAGALVKANVLAEKIFDMRNVDNFSEIISSFEEIQGEDIVIEGFTFNRDKNSLAPLVIEGEAKDRRALADFKDRLSKLENISEVILPISDLAKNKDIQFSMTINFKNES